MHIPKSASAANFVWQQNTNIKTGTDPCFGWLYPDTDICMRTLGGKVSTAESPGFTIPGFVLPLENSGKIEVILPGRVRAMTVFSCIYGFF